MRDVPGRHPSAARLAGDDYQHLVTWNEVLLALRRDSSVETITVEAPDAGNVDDVVVAFRDHAHVYTQAKHGVDATSPVGTHWLLARVRGGSSLLTRFHDSWKLLGGSSGRVRMQLVTDREIDSGDPLMRLLDRRTELLVPSIESGALPKNAREARRQWADHLGTGEEELIDMLRSLRFRTGRPFNAEVERAETLMLAHGLVAEEASINNGIAMVREWVQERWRSRSVDELRQLVNSRVERQGDDEAALLVVEAIDNDMHPEDATVLLRWVERYAGKDPNDRRQLTDPDDWERTVGPQLEAATQTLRESGVRRVVVRGQMRLPLWFAVGAALRHVHRFDIATYNHGEVWASEMATSAPISPQVESASLKQGKDVAVVVSAATDGLPAVLRYASDSSLPIADVLSLSPPGGPGPQSVSDGGTAAHLAIGMRDAIRGHLEKQPGERLHLFMAGPAGLALLIGHRWNAMRPTIVYEHLGVGFGYAPTLTVRG